MTSNLGEKSRTVGPCSQTVTDDLNRNVGENVELILFPHAAGITARIDHREERLPALAPASITHLHRCHLAAEINGGGKPDLTRWGCDGYQSSYLSYRRSPILSGQYKSS